VTAAHLAPALITAWPALGPGLQAGERPMTRPANPGQVPARSVAAYFFQGRSIRNG
jgi:hypothetical protein